MLGESGAWLRSSSQHAAPPPPPCCFTDVTRSDGDGGDPAQQLPLRHHDNTKMKPSGRGGDADQEPGVTVPPVSRRGTSESELVNPERAAPRPCRDPPGQRGAAEG